MTQIEPQTHESEAFLYYAPDPDGDEPHDWDGLDPYWALSSLLIDECDGFHEIETEIDGEAWTLQLAYHKSGIAPARDHQIDSERLYEIQINCQGPGQKKADYVVKPRFPEMRHYESGDQITTPFDHLDDHETGVTVHAQPSNLPLDRIPQLYARAIFEIASDVDVGIYHGYFDEPVGGRVAAIERYVRIRREINRKVIAKGGVLNRLAMHLADVKGTKGVYKWDNEEIKGHHHVIRHGSTSAAQLVDRHRLGGQIKSYLPQHPEDFDPDDPLYHPKVATKFVKGRNESGAVDWADRHEIVDELDERLLSILSWADVPIEAGGTTYVADDHFDASGADDPVPIHADPLPDLEARQEHILLTCLRDMTPADEEIVGEIATDGGTHARDLAADTGLSISTIYRCLDRMDGLLTSENGHVRFVSEHLRREVHSIVESVESTIESAADRVGELVDHDVRQSASSAFDRWLAKYGAEFDAPIDGDGDPVVRVDTILSQYKSSPHPRLEEIVDEMLTAWRKDGRDVAILLDAILEAPVDGRRERRPVRTLR